MGKCYFDSNESQTWWTLHTWLLHASEWVRSYSTAGRSYMSVHLQSHCSNKCIIQWNIICFLKKIFQSTLWKSGQQCPCLVPSYISFHNFPNPLFLFSFFPAFTSVLLSLSWPESLTTMKWGLSPIVRRPREETGAGPAALSGAVRYPDRKQLEGCCCHWTPALRSAASPGRAVRKPGLIYGSIHYYSWKTQTWMLVYFVWSRQLFADVLCRSVSGRFRPVFSQGCRLAKRVNKRPPDQVDNNKTFYLVDSYIRCNRSPCNVVKQAYLAHRCLFSAHLRTFVACLHVRVNKAQKNAAFIGTNSAFGSVVSVQGSSLKPFPSALVSAWRPLCITVN